MEALTSKSDLERLPVELKMMIMQKLTQQDLCNVALVSKNLNSVALDPSLWTQVTISIFPTIPVRDMKKMIHSHRFKKIKVLKIMAIDDNFEHVPPQLLSYLDSKSRQISAILMETINLKSLVELDLRGITSLEDVPPQLLMIAVSKLEKANLTGIHIPPKQLVAVLIGTVKSTSLIELNLGGNDFSDLPAEFLGKAISKLKKADLEDTCLSTEQVVTILEETIKSNSLTELSICFNNLEDVPAKVLSKAISKLEKADLSSTDLSTEQVVAIFEEAIKSNSLTELIFKCNDMNDVPAGVLSKAISKLKKADLEDTGLSTEQVVAIFEETFKSNSLIELNIDCSELNLKDVPAKVLGKGIAKLKIADLTRTDLSTEQLVAILEETIKSNSLTVLYLENYYQNKNFTDVPAGVLSKAISKLKEAFLQETNLSTEQLVAILEETISSKSLTLLSLVGNNFEHVPPQLLGNAFSNLKYANLIDTDLSTEQVVAILEETIKSNSLTRLDLGSKDLTDVPAGILSKAISKLEETFLEDTNLSTEQLVAILEETIKSNSLTRLDLDSKDLTDVPAGILSKAISKLEEARLNDTNLSTEQLVAILDETITSKSLTMLSLDDNNFEHVPPQLLSKAISKLKKTDVSFVSYMEEVLGDLLSYMEKALEEFLQKKTPIHSDSPQPLPPAQTSVSMEKFWEDFFSQSDADLAIIANSGSYP